VSVGVINSERKGVLVAGISDTKRTVSLIGVLSSITALYRHYPTVGTGVLVESSLLSNFEA
jgi:hypothetical protein